MILQKTNIYYLSYRDWKSHDEGAGTQHASVCIIFLVFFRCQQGTLGRKRKTLTSQPEVLLSLPLILQRWSTNDLVISHQASVPSAVVWNIRFPVLIWGNTLKQYHHLYDIFYFLSSYISRLTENYSQIISTGYYLNLKIVSWDYIFTLHFFNYFFYILRL